MSECQHKNLCVKRWDGSDRRCAFDDEDRFTAENWNCGIVNLVRALVNEDQLNMPREVDYQYCDDNKYATVNIDDVDLEPSVSALWVGWYKSRGATMAMWLLDHYAEPRRPTRTELIAIVRHFGLYREDVIDA